MHGCTAALSNSVRIQNPAMNNRKQKQTSLILGQKQPKETGHTLQVSVEKRTQWDERGGRGKKKVRCSPWECSSITGRLRLALSHCHSDATSTLPERSPSYSLHCFKHTHTHTDPHTHTHTPIAHLQEGGWTHSHLLPFWWWVVADTNKIRYAKRILHHLVLNNNLKIDTLMKLMKIILL